MNTLLRLFIRNGGFLTLVLVEAFCFYLIVRYNTNQQAVYVHSMGRLASNLLEYRQRASDYLNLDQRADSLQAENARLRTQIENARLVKLSFPDTAYVALFDSLSRNDSLMRRIVRPAFVYVPARVVGNNVNGSNNWMILNRGTKDGIEKNSGVIAADGLAGIVWHADPEFSLAMSLLHRETRISAMLARQQSFGSLIWEGGDPEIMTLKYIPKHIQVQERDSVVTSGYSQLFPRGLVIGFVDGKPVPDKENPYFLIIRVRLSHDMTRTNEVYVIRNIFRNAIDSLKQRVQYEW